MERMMEQFIIDVYKGEPGEHPWHVYLRRVNIDPKGYEVGEFHGRSLNSLLSKAGKKMVSETEGN